MRTLRRFGALVWQTDIPQWYQIRPPPTQRLAGDGTSHDRGTLAAVPMRHAVDAHGHSVFSKNR